jgi:hypothetical protein
MFCFLSLYERLRGGEGQAQMKIPNQIGLRDVG